MSTTTEETVAAEQAEYEQGQNPDKGQLFEVPRAAIDVDESDPNVIKLQFSGAVELDRGNAAAVGFYNSLERGQEVALGITAFVASRTTTSRRDSEGNVDTIVQSKSLKVHTVEPA